MAFLGTQPLSKYCNEVWDSPSSSREFGLLLVGAFAEEPVVGICLTLLSLSLFSLPLPLSPSGVEEEHIKELSP